MVVRANQTFLVNKNKIQESKIDLLNIESLGEGEILLSVDKYAFTSNNITYAAIGHQVGYWKFFPVDKEYGIVPVWGFGTVVESKNPTIAVGQRYYGYYPMSSYVKMIPGRMNLFGFTDITEHRNALPPIYNNYTNCEADLVYKPEYEEVLALMRPLYLTSYLIEDFLMDNDRYGASQVVLTSASSKTAIALAHAIRNNAKNSLHVVGLTSNGNREFVKSLDLYDQIISYDDINTIKSQDSVIVDFRGNGGLLNELSDHLGQHLKYCSLVGLVDWTQYGKGKPLPNATLFFAPSQAQKRAKELGAAEFGKQSGLALSKFISFAQSIVSVQKTTNFDDVATLYKEMVKGVVDPQIGHIVEISS